MRHHEVDLQLCQLVGANGYVTKRTESCGHSINGSCGLGNLPVEVFSTFDDALTCVVAKFEFVTFLNDFADTLNRKMFC